MRLLSGFLETVPSASAAGAVPSAASQHVSTASSFKEEAVECDWLHMQLGNNIGHWVGDRPGIKYTYDHDLKGVEIRSWWPGRAGGGECNDITDGKRGCWYRGRMLNDPSCDEINNHCLHFAAHDGEPAHTYTCPTWVKDHEGMPCKLPKDWQFCPEKFLLLRIDSGVPQEFKESISKPCGPMGEDHCLGNTEFETNTGMIFDLRANQWYRCTPWMKCQKYDIQDIHPPGKKGKCGQFKCKKNETCFNHKVTSKESVKSCMDKNKIYLISAGDDMFEAATPIELAIWAGFPVAERTPSERAWSAVLTGDHRLGKRRPSVRRWQSQSFL